MFNGVDGFVGFGGFGGRVLIFPSPHVGVATGPMGVEGLWIRI